MAAESQSNMLIEHEKKFVKTILECEGWKYHFKTSFLTNRFSIDNKTFNILNIK